MSNARALILTAAGCLTAACFHPSSPDDGTDTDTTPGTGSEGTDAPDDGASMTEGTTTSEPSTGTDTGVDSTDDGVCNAEGCACTGEADCADGLLCGPDDTCVAPVCGNGRIEGDEQCEANDRIDGDGCDADCTYTEIEIDVSYQSTCALIEGGRVRCWGHNSGGELGYGNTENVGDDEVPSDAGDLTLPQPVFELASGDSHTCARLDDRQSVVCWGVNGGRLGYANVDAIGDDEFLTNLTAVDVGAAIDHVTVGGTHTCVITDAGQVRCWGLAFSGQLGYGNLNTIGDDETPAVAGNVNVGAAINDVSAGIGHTCAIQSNGNVRCWGGAFAGQLGYGNMNDIGDDETPAQAAGAPLDFGEDAVQIGAGLQHTCARFASGNVRCWGQGSQGQLGQAAVTSIGDDETASLVPPIDLGGPAVEIAAGDNHTCALLDDGAFRCWGSNVSGQLGLGNVAAVGDDEVPSAVAAIELDGAVVDFDAGGEGTCVVLDDFRVRCWGGNEGGQLGYGDTITIGDDELPTSVGPVSVL